MGGQPQLQSAPPPQQPQQQTFNFTGQPRLISPAASVNNGAPAGLFPGGGGGGATAPSAVPQRFPGAAAPAAASPGPLPGQLPQSAAPPGRATGRCGPRAALHRRPGEEEADPAATGAAVARVQVSAPGTDGRRTAGGEVLNWPGRQYCIGSVYFGDSVAGVSHGCYPSVACSLVITRVWHAPW